MPKVTLGISIDSKLLYKLQVKAEKEGKNISQLIGEFILKGLDDKKNKKEVK